MPAVQSNAAQKNPLVFLWTEILFLPGGLPGAWAGKREDPCKEVRERSVLHCKNGKNGG